jgi:hypothetical protein
VVNQRRNSKMQLKAVYQKGKSNQNNKSEW